MDGPGEMSSGDTWYLFERSSIMAKKTKMSPEAAKRIQSATDKGGTDDGFKERAQAAVAKNTSGKGGKTKSK